MIGYCPLDDIEPPRPIVEAPRQVAKPKKKEHCECNIIVMSFVIGVILLSLMDILKK